MRIKTALHTAYKALGAPYLAPLLWAEQRTQKGPINERGVEYAFALRELSALGGIERVLDVGSGDKAWPALLSDCGYEVTAIDKARVLNRHFRVERKDITDPKYLRYGFDAITCISTIEHIHPVLESLALCEMSWHLRRGGHLIITMPCTNKEYRYDVWNRTRPYITQSLTLNRVMWWERWYRLRLVNRRMYIGYSGEYWGEGKRHSPPLVAVNEDEMNLGCFHFVKGCGDGLP